MMDSPWATAAAATKGAARRPAPAHDCSSAPSDSPGEQKDLGVAGCDALCLMILSSLIVRGVMWRVAWETV